MVRFKEVLFQILNIKEIHLTHFTAMFSFGLFNFLRLKIP